ncbi:MAG: tetratricopeptide repeat protein [Anaerolineales bacterium]|nr:tetratricopeptide repeat protein [Anaerolineales bacterium]
MDESSLEELLLNANRAVMEGNWAEALQHLQQACDIQPYNADLFTAIGGVYVQMGKAEEGLHYYEEALRLQPYSAQAYQNLANAYTILGRFPDAEQAYRRALELDEDDRFSWMGLARVCIVQERYQEGVEILAALVRSDPQDPQAMTLLAECYEQAGDPVSARYLYQQALNVDGEYELAKQGLERVRSQEVTLGEIDKQAIAQKLAALKSKLQAQQARLTPTKPVTTARLLFCGPAMVSSEVRFGALAQALNQRGYQVRVTTRWEDVPEAYQFVLFSRPHDNDELTQAVQNSKASGAKVIVDLDEDFFTLPAGYYHYSTLSAANPMVASRLRQVLQIADVVTVPSEALVEVYRNHATRIALLPFGWDESNPMWTKPVLRGTAIKIGILANHTQPPDLSVLGDCLQQIYKENEQVLIGVVGSMAVYEELRGIEEERKFFVPLGRIEDYPFLLADFDLLLFPLADNPYNRSKSDLALLECGARKVCWVASPIPAYQTWEKGGLFASSSGEWTEAIENLVNSPAKRYQLAEEAHRKAQQRTIAKMAEQWIGLLQSL